MFRQVWTADWKGNLQLRNKDSPQKVSEESARARGAIRSTLAADALEFKKFLWHTWYSVCSPIAQ